MCLLPCRAGFTAPTGSSSRRPRLRPAAGRRDPARRPRTRCSCCGASDDRARHDDGGRTRRGRPASRRAGPTPAATPVADLGTPGANATPLVCFLAVGATVRLIAPLLAGQATRPCSGLRRRGRPVRRAGRRRPSRRERARRTGCREPRRDPRHHDGHRRRRHCRDSTRWAGRTRATWPRCRAALLDGEPVALWQDGARVLAAAARCPSSVIGAPPAAGPAILVTDRTDLALPVPSVVLRPPSLDGRRRREPRRRRAEVLDLIRAALHDAAPVAGVRARPRHRRRQGRRGRLARGSRNAGRPAVTLTPPRHWRRSPCPNPSDVVRARSAPPASPRPPR